MTEKIVALAKKFIEIRSIPSNPKGLDGALDLAVNELQGFTIEHFDHNGIKSALVFNTETKPENFKLILNCHLDVIPAKESQYTPEIEGDRLYGAGAMDMKSNVACAIIAFREVAKKIPYPIAIQLVTDEQQGGFDGTKHQIESGVSADFVLATEPTNFDIVYKAKGVLWLRISALGKSAHGAYPWRGENAIMKMNTFLQKLMSTYPNPKEQAWVTTVNVSTIATKNDALNKIPDDCVAELDIRYVSNNADSILNEIKKLAKECNVQFEVLVKEPAMHVPKDNHYLTTLKDVSKKILGKDIILRGAQGTSDARHFAAIGAAGVEFGPIGGDIGGDNEWVDIPSLDKYYEIIKAFLLEIAESK